MNDSSLDCGDKVGLQNDNLEEYKRLRYEEELIS